MLVDSRIDNIKNAVVSIYTAVDMRILGDGLDVAVYVTDNLIEVRVYLDFLDHTESYTYVDGKLVGVNYTAIYIVQEGLFLLFHRMAELFSDISWEDGRSLV